MDGLINSNNFKFSLFNNLNFLFIAIFIFLVPKISSASESFSCGTQILSDGGSAVNNAGNNAVRICEESLAKGNLLEGAGAAGLAEHGGASLDALADSGASQQAAGASDLLGVGKMVHASAGAKYVEAMKICSQQREEFIRQVKVAASSIGPRKADPQLSAAAVSCEQSLIQFSNAVENRIRPVIAEMNRKAQENALGYAINASGSSVSKSISDALGSNMGMLAVGAGLGYLGSQMLGKKDKDGNGDGSGGGNGFTVSTQESGGQCLSYGKDQEKCYTNSELSSMCFNSGSDNSAMMGYLANQGTEKMQKALCNAFMEDTREGAGGHEGTCHIKKPEYWKDQACEARMTAQCQTSEFGDCRLFNSHFCHSEGEDLGEGSNYCVYRLALDYCNNGGGGMSSPACAWVRQVNEAGANGGKSCLTDINQPSCFPSAYDSYAALMEACSVMGVGGKDPLCNSIDSSKLFFSWRNPGAPESGQGGANSEGSQQAGNSEENNNADDKNLETVADNKCIKPEVNCANIQYRDTPACVDYYCCQPINSASPICRSLSYGTASAGGGGLGSSANRYPAGSLPSDILTFREESIFTSSTHNSVAQRLCKNGELYDCGALQGVVPRSGKR